MRVALYTPQIPDENTTPPLGPLYLLAVLEKHGFEGRLFDARVDKLAFRKLVGFRPDVIGVSAVTPGYLGGLRLVSRIKEIFPEIFVVFGGPHPSSLPAEVISNPSVDFVLVGESEISFLMLCQRLRDGETSPASLREVKNLVFSSGQSIIATERSPFLADNELDDLPRPAFHLMDLEAYFANTQTHGIFRRGQRILPIMSTRGCPFACTFCCRVMGKSIGSRSISSVMAEIHFLITKYGLDELYFEDDNFTFKRDRALAILESIAAIKPGIFLKFANGLRADMIDRELLQAMKRARVYSLSFGIESGCETTLQKMKKSLDLEKARENVLLAKSMGFLVGANCIIGYPGESVEDLEKSLAFFQSLSLDSMAIVNAVPFPGTDLRRICEQEGCLTEEAGNWDNYYFSINKPIPLIETRHLSKEQLIHFTQKAYRKMYLSPRWLWRSLRHLSPSQMARGAAIMLGLRRPQKTDDIRD